MKNFGLRWLLISLPVLAFAVVWGCEQSPGRTGATGPMGPSGSSNLTLSFFVITYYWNKNTGFF